MDSMVNKYTANKRLRSDNAYTPDARPDMRPDYPSIVYTQILKKLYPDVPVVLGGIEASMRRVTHYDYWQDKLMKSILVESGADLLIYGMGEKPVVELIRRFNDKRLSLNTIPQIAYLCKTTDFISEEGDIRLFSHAECLKDKKKAGLPISATLKKRVSNIDCFPYYTGSGWHDCRCHPPYPPLTEAELDHSYDLPYTRLPHPKYKGKRDSGIRYD